MAKPKKRGLYWVTIQMPCKVKPFVKCPELPFDPDPWTHLMTLRICLN